MTANDLELLRRYAAHGSQEAFTALVNRHLDLVYSAALRQVRQPQLAEEVAQSVFIELSRSAEKIEPGSILSAWLYRVTRCRAIDVVRRESRRQLREQIAWETNDMSQSESGWNQIEPLLDEAMDALDEADRGAILLRYFQNKTLREVGEALGTSEDAAQKRVSRAIERLREFFTRKKITLGAAGLAAVISTNAVEAAPAGLGATISAAALLTSAAIHTSPLIGVTKAIAMITIQKSLIAAAIAASLGTGIYEATRASQFSDQVQSLEQQLSQTADRNSHALDDSANKIAALQSENDQLRRRMSSLKTASDEVAERQAQDAAAAKNPTAAAMTAWLDRVDRLRQRLAQTPGAQIPEMQFLTEQDWLNAAKDNLDTDTDFRRAMGTVRSIAEDKFTTNLQPALRQYMAANNNQFPTGIAQLQPFFNPPIDPAILQRYEVAPASTVPNVNMGGDWIITQKAAVDDEYDGRTVIGPGGTGSLGSPGAYDTVSLSTLMNPVMKSYMSANNGQQPTDPSQLIPYATNPVQQAALQKIIQSRTAGGN